MKLYELPRDQNIKIYGGKDTDTNEDVVIIFGHIDGMYSYCWIENQPDKLVHINASTEVDKYKDGYIIAVNGKERA